MAGTAWSKSRKGRRLTLVVAPGTRSAVDYAPQDLAGDDDPLDLAGPLADLADLGIAHHPLDRIVGGVAIAAEDLHRLGGGAHGQLGAEELGHGGLLLMRLAGLLEAR